MTFNEGIQLDASNIDTGSGGGGFGRGPQLALGGGVGGIIILVLGLLLGGNDGSNPLSGGGAGEIAQSSAGDPQLQAKIAQCAKDSSFANSDLTCRILYTSNSVDAVWSAQFPKQTGRQYVKPRLVIFHQSVQTGCGFAQSSIGPFYCPADHKAYFDPTFFRQLQSLGASDDKLAQEYVVAHEYGHHISTLLGTIRASQGDQRGAESGAVRTELQADCFAGAWAHWAAQPGPRGERPLIREITEDDVRETVKTADAIGDDSLQARAGRRANPNSFTHGSGEQRQVWFLRGYKSGQIADCDTFRARDLNNP